MTGMIKGGEEGPPFISVTLFIVKVSRFRYNKTVSIK